MSPRFPTLFATLGFLLLLVAGPAAQQIRPAPDRPAGEGDGPFDRLVLRGVTVIDGTGAPPQGPIDIVIAGNRIAEVRAVGYPGIPIRPESRPAKGTREIDGAGLFVMPGFVDLHTHIGGAPKAPDAEYVYKLWLAHGVTTDAGRACRPDGLDAAGARAGAPGTRSPRRASSPTTARDRRRLDRRRVSPRRRRRANGWTGRPGAASTA